MSIRKRALSLLLVLVMLLGVLPAGAAAAEVYQDVPSGHWASDYIARVAEQGLMVGTSDTTFAPEETITRAMFVRSWRAIPRQKRTTMLKRRSRMSPPSSIKPAPLPGLRLTASSTARAL